MLEHTQNSACSTQMSLVMKCMVFSTITETTSADTHETSYCAAETVCCGNSTPPPICIITNDSAGEDDEAIHALETNSSPAVAEVKTQSKWCTMCSAGAVLINLFM